MVALSVTPSALESAILTSYADDSKVSLVFKDPTDTLRLKNDLNECNMFEYNMQFNNAKFQVFRYQATSKRQLKYMRPAKI